MVLIKIVKKYFPLIIVLIFIWGCDKDGIVDIQFKDYTQDFVSVWTTFAEKYPLFEYKNINWDEIYQRYKDQFISISIEERNNKLAEIFGIFKDAHIYLETSDQKLLGQYFPLNFTTNYNRQYLSNFVDSIDWHSESKYWGWANLNKVGYIKFTDFKISSVDIKAFDNAMESLRLTDGIIIDIREMHGGNLFLIEDIWNRFTNQKIVVGYQLFRNGPGYNDFATQISIVTNPRGEWQYLKNVVVLIGQSCFSAGEILAETFSHFPNTAIIGDTTFGGVEAPQIYTLPDGTQYSVPIVAYLNALQEPLEWRGVIPDIYFDPSEIVNNPQFDKLLDEAFKIINQNVTNQLFSPDRPSSFEFPNYTNRLDGQVWYF